MKLKWEHVKRSKYRTWKNWYPERTIEALLDSNVIVLVMSLEFARKQRFKLKKIEELIYVRNLNRIFNKKRPIENTVEVNIFYKKYKRQWRLK